MVFKNYLRLSRELTVNELFILKMSLLQARSSLGSGRYQVFDWERFPCVPKPFWGKIMPVG